MMKYMFRAALPITLGFALAGCGGQTTKPTSGEADTHGDEGHDAEGAAEKGAAGNDQIHLTERQITAAGIQLARPSGGGAAILRLSATIESDPQATQVVSAAVGGRVVVLRRNLGEAVRRGETLAVIESREAAGLRAEVEAAAARGALARSELVREDRLFKLKVSPERDLVAARAAATEANIALRLARQQLAAAGVAGGSLNRIGIVAPIGGRITARSVILGQTVTPDAELFRVADLGQVAIRLALSPADAGKIRVGTMVEVMSGERRAQARIGFVSPVLDEATRLVPAIASLANGAGVWRPGEPVTVVMTGERGAGALAVSEKALQTVEGKTVVFVRTAEGFRGVPVVVTSRGGGQASVTGLKGNELIASEGSFTLKAELGKGEAEHGH